MPTWDEVIAAVTLTLNGDRATGRAQMLACWDNAGAHDHAQRCVLAHYLADTETDLAAEITWDERALASHSEVEDSDLVAVGIPSASAMAPSLHLNLGDAYLRAGRVADARDHANLGIEATAVLGNGGYEDLIRAGLARLSGRIDAADQGLVD